MSYPRLHGAALLLLLPLLGSCGSDRADRDGSARSGLALRWLFAPGLVGSMSSPSAHVPGRLWEEIQTHFPGQHERGGHPWTIKAFELHPWVAGMLNLESVTYDPEAPGDPSRTLAKWPLHAGSRYLLALGMGPAGDAGDQERACRALLFAVDAESRDDPGSIRSLEQELALPLPSAPTGAPIGRWHDLAVQADVSVTGLTAFTGSFDMETMLMVWAPDPTGTIRYDSVTGPQIHGRPVVKGEYPHPLVALTLRYP